MNRAATNSDLYVCARVLQLERGKSKSVGASTDNFKAAESQPVTPNCCDAASDAECNQKLAKTRTKCAPKNSATRAKSSRTENPSLDTDLPRRQNRRRHPSVAQRGED